MADVTHRPEGLREAAQQGLDGNLRDVLSKTAKRGVLPGHKVSK